MYTGFWTGFLFQTCNFGVYRKNNLTTIAILRKRVEISNFFLQCVASKKKKIMYLKSRIKWPNLLLKNEWFNLMSCLHHVWVKPSIAKNSYWPVEGQMNFSKNTNITKSYLYTYHNLNHFILPPKTTLVHLGYYFIVTWYLKKGLIVLGLVM